VKPHFHVVLAI
nr:zona pellucida-binding protein, AWN-1=T6 fragment [swine, sperm, Peptide Partial, 11 aa] [Sus scrofa]